MARGKTPGAGRSRVRRPLLRRYELWISLIVFVLAVAASVREPFFVVALREAVFDGYQRLHPRPYKLAPVVIIDIDEASLGRLGQWPWPRTRLADVVRRVRDAGAAAIAFDMLFAEPDRTSPRLMVPQWQNDPGMQNWLGTLDDHDEQLALSFEGLPTVTGFALVPAAATALPKVKAGFAFTGGDPRPFLPEYQGAVSTLATLEDAAAGNGALNVTLAQGGVVRRVPLLLRLGEQIYPSLVAEALRVAQGADTILVKLAGGAGETSFGQGTGLTHVRVGAFTIPTDANGQVWVYFTEPQPARYIPAWELLAGHVPRERLDGAIVVVGSTALGLQDIHATPLGITQPGVSVHVQVLEQILHDVHLIRPDWAKGGEIFLLVALGTLVLVLGQRVGAVSTAIVGGTATLAAFATSWFAFSHARILVDPVFPAAAVFAIYLVYSLLRHLQAEREGRWIRNAFSSYVSPKLVEQLVHNPDYLQLNGERRELTFIFTDLAGFTSLIERSEPTQILPVLNAYLDGLIRIAFEYEGTVDKIVGDAVHVIFGAPVADAAHAEHAVACALALDVFAQSFAEERHKEGIPFGATRIGVNSGVAIVGNFGGEMRFDYTAHGDVVNTAARLEGANKFFGTRICVSADTVGRCAAFVGRPAGDVVLKGKTQPVRIFEPLSPGAAAAFATKLYLEAFRQMEDGEPLALSTLEAVLRATPEDALAKFHLDRLRAGETGTRIVLTEK
jgi:adenylate cyclase